jgi:hypothetical protein
LASAEARLARFGLVDLDVPPFELGIVELPDRIGGFFRSRHLDKAEASRLSGEFIRDDRGALHLTRLREELVEIVIRNRKGQIAWRSSSE